VVAAEMARCTARLHGSQWAYHKLGCRCPSAVAAMAPRWRRQSQSRRARQRAAGVVAVRPSREVDPIAVEVACTGRRRLRLTPSERRAAVARLTRFGLSTRVIAERLHVAERTVQRHRAALRTSGAVS
jgi:DNA-binding NarL/FixJ family response regulator